MVRRLKTFIDTYYAKYLTHSFFVRHKRILLYLVFGGTAATIDLGIYLALFNIFSIPAIESTVISIATATLVGFILNAIVNFDVKDNHIIRFIMYSAVSAVGMLISVAMLYILNTIYGFDGNIVKILSLPMIFVIQYFLNSRISFRAVK